jgi:hypothetical protein
MKPQLSVFLYATFSLMFYYTVSAQLHGFQAAGAGRDPYGIFISTGDNNYSGNCLPIDSKAAIDASFDLFKDLGAGHVYWRGLESGVWMELNHVRKESPRYYALWKWLRHLDSMGLDRYASDAAHKRGMQIWGVGNIGDWASAGDVPPFDDYPYNSESRLRIEHPEWVPVDRRGILKQGGSIDFCYPEARRAMCDIHMKIIKQHGYDGAMFFTYAENHSVRFQDEFGYNQPVVDEFKRRYGIDLRTQNFTRSASRLDWVRLRGEYFTQFYRELREEFKKNNYKLAVVLDPHDIYYTQPWNIPEIMQTSGPIYQDLETWLSEDLIDQFVVFGSASGILQSKAIKDAFWLSRNTPVTVAAFTSSPPNAERWAPFIRQGLSIIDNFNEEEMYLDRSVIPEQPVSSLKSSQDVLCMRVLSQIIYGKTKASIADLIPLTKHKNLLIRRMALKSLGLSKDPKAVRVTEQGLKDPENAVRSIAALAVGLNPGPQSHKKLLETVEKFGNLSLNEIVLRSLVQIGEPIKSDLVKAVKTSKNGMVRTTALRAMEKLVTAADLSLLKEELNDDDLFARFTAAKLLASIQNSNGAIELLIQATTHEDPVVSDRAATSLGSIVVRKELSVEGLRVQILEALKVLYGKLGEGCQRVDAEWGYRPVGNALLAMGADGEAVLKGFMLQKEDKRLAESAWKSLYIRQKPNSFSEVTEKENAEAFRMRPAFLDEPRKREK